MWFKPWWCHAGQQLSVVVLRSRFKELVAQMGALNISEALGLGPTGNTVKSTFVGHQVGHNLLIISQAQ